MHLGSTYGAPVLVLVVLMILGASVWACVGSVPRMATASGILTHANGSFILRSPRAGQITTVSVREGAAFRAGASLFTIRTDTRNHVVRAVAGGRAIAVAGKVGQIVVAADALATIERFDVSTDPLVASVYVAGNEIASIRPGAQVTMSVQSAPAREFGLLEGTVAVLSRFPQSQDQVSGFLSDDRLGARFAGDTQPWQVLVRLIPANTASGFSWTTDEGPPYQLDSRALVEAQFHLAPIRPIAWLTAR